MLTSVVERLLALLALVAMGISLVSVLALIRGRVPAWLAEAALPLAAAVAIVATGGSLYLSEVAGYIPCALCWYQRIAMYPLVVVVGVAALRRDLTVWLTALPLAVIGAAIAAWHVAVERVPDLGSGVCDPTAPCTILWVEEFGFLTIPTMALIGFITIAMLVLVARRGADTPA
ncbi:MAG TPA: disulfide bond formation protein B [Egicoccus sp.]|nr:disulfide bond formation protein B [Egicoccus sp.]HSK24343.1 disulfide bond formation protein B [Egicoccus sp.]